MALERIWSWVNCTLIAGFALLLVLKLTGIDWSWWLVCSPLLLFVVILVGAFAIMGLSFPHLLESSPEQQSKGDDARRPRPVPAQVASPPSTRLVWLDAIQAVIVGIVIFGGCAGLIGWGLYRYYGAKFSTFWGGVFAVIALVYGLVRAAIAIAGDRGNQQPIRSGSSVEDKREQGKPDEPAGTSAPGPDEAPRQ
jgi:hypothetical protein